MTDIQHIEKEILQLLQKAPAQNSGLISITLPLNGVLVHSLPQISDQRYFWMRPESGRQWLGLGTALCIEREGEDHLTGLADASEELNNRIHHLDPEGYGTAPA